MKTTLIKTILGVIGSSIALALGGWDMALQTLISFMIIDYLSGLMVAIVFKKSGKSITGTFSSSSGFRGLCKKGVMLLVVYVAVRLEMTMGMQGGLLRNAVIIGLIVNELGSITENFAVMGVPMPKPILEALEVMKKKE